MKLTKKDFVTYTSNEKVQIRHIDKQHENMCQIINKIYNAREKNKYSVVGTQLRKFLDLLKLHFAYEEDLMKQTKFTGYITHKLEHDRVLKKIEAIAILYPKDASILTIEILDGLKNWFYNHLEISDRKCGEHFVAMGIK